jgi:hypothetical protein
MTNQIVTINVSQNIGATPSILQRTGAFVSQGATSKPVNSLTLLTSLADLSAVIKGALPLSTLTWTTGVVTATTTAPHGWTTGTTHTVVISGATPSGYNGTFTATATTASAFTYPLATSPGASTVPGKYTVDEVDELNDMATTFFSQGSSIGVYVLELGPGDAAAGAAALTTWLTNNPNVVYSFLLPRYWDNTPGLLTLIANYESTTAMTYFWVTTTPATYTNYVSNMKSAVTMVEAPTPPGLFQSEFSLASAFWVTLHYKPSPTNKVTPLCFSYLFSVTPYPVVGTAPLRSQLKDRGVNIVSVGTEGGITNDMLLWGTNMDARPFNYWYSVDWVQINLKLQLANTIINGSNNPINPLYLNQDGINRLQVVAAKVMSTAITVGLALGTVVQLELNSEDLADYFDSGAGAGQIVVNAIPFVDYYTSNPGDYKIGVYDGLSVVFTPLRGFDNITVNVNVTDIVA